MYGEVSAWDIQFYQGLNNNCLITLLVKWSLGKKIVFVGKLTLCNQYHQNDLKTASAYKPVLILFLPGNFIMGMTPSVCAQWCLLVVPGLSDSSSEHCCVSLHREPNLPRAQSHQNSPSWLCFTLSGLDCELTFSIFMKNCHCPSTNRSKPQWGVCFWASGSFLHSIYPLLAFLSALVICVSARNPLPVSAALSAPSQPCGTFK